MSTDKKTIDWYNAHAEEYEQHLLSPETSLYHAYYEKPAMYGLLPDLKGKEVISLGCGTGKDSKYLFDQGAKRSVGVDISEKQIEIAKKNYPECEFYLMDIEKIDFQEASFDFAYSSLAFQYLEDWEQALSVIYKVLKPGTKFLFSCEHPLHTAMEVTLKDDTRTERELSMKRDKVRNTYTVLGDYTHRHTTPTGISPDVTTWHKSFSDMFDQIRAAGFEVKSLVEPQPTEEMRKINPNEYEILKNLPFFIIFEAEKSA